MARPSAFAHPEWKEKSLGKAVMFGFQDSRPIKEQRMGLPIFPFREQILQGVKDNQIIILSAETGSGKTTQVTQYLAEAGWTSKVRLASQRCVCNTRRTDARNKPPLQTVSTCAPCVHQFCRHLH